MVDNINIAMGCFEIECDKDKIIWRATEKLSGDTAEFENLDELVEWIRYNVDSVEIKEG